MFTQWVKIHVWGITGKSFIMYDELSQFDGWFDYCRFELFNGHIGGFSVTITDEGR
jgi:hypothetical protein